MDNSWCFSSDGPVPNSTSVSENTAVGNFVSHLPVPLEQGLDALQNATRYELRAGQKQALTDLYHGEDVILVAKTGYGKTLVMTGFNKLLNPSLRPLTLILSPLKAIEHGQARELQERFGNDFRPFVLDGDSNSPKARYDIARGNYTHVWLSADIAINDIVDPSENDDEDDAPAQQTSKGKERKSQRAPRRSKITMDGYEDRGTFTSVLQDDVFRRRLQLVAIDELHLCARTSWGGSFRPALGQISKLRDQLDEHTRLFGTTATLTSKNLEEIRASAGFDNDVEPIRTEIYRDDVFIKMLPTDDWKTMCRQILYTALEEALASPERRLSKMIFFVDEVKQTQQMKEFICRWLKARGQHTAAEEIVWTYHGQLSNSSRAEIEGKFERGEIVILCTTIAYAVGVNPPGVKYVIQKGRCSLEDALQKLGRGNRGGLRAGEKAVFYWLPEAKVIGPLERDIPIDQRQGRKRATRKTTMPLLPGELEPFRVAETSGTVHANSFPHTQPKKVGKNISPAAWREQVLTPEEFEVYNAPESQCIWTMLLKPFEEVRPSPCNNCSNCKPEEHSLVELAASELQGTEKKEVIRVVKKALEELAVDLGNEEDNEFMRSLCPEIKERVLNSQERKDFSASYLCVARGDHLGWSWASKYGTRVTDKVRQAIAEVRIGSELVDANDQPLARTVHTQLSLPVASVPKIAVTSVSHEIGGQASCNNSNLRLTARGASYIVDMKVARGKKRGIAARDEPETNN